MPNFRKPSQHSGSCCSTGFDTAVTNAVAAALLERRDIAGARLFAAGNMNADNVHFYGMHAVDIDIDGELAQLDGCDEQLGHLHDALMMWVFINGLEAAFGALARRDAPRQ